MEAAGFCGSRPSQKRDGRGTRGCVVDAGDGKSRFLSGHCMQRTRGFRRATVVCGASVGRGVRIPAHRKSAMDGAQRGCVVDAGDGRSRFPSGMTDKEARATARAKAEADSLRGIACSGRAAFAAPSVEIAGDGGAPFGRGVGIPTHSAKSAEWMGHSVFCGGYRGWRGPCLRSETWGTRHPAFAALSVGFLGVWRFCLTALLLGQMAGFSGACAHGFNRAVER